MAKRNIDTMIWDDVWFQDLSPDQKCFWIYLTTKCDVAGCWKVNKSLAEFQVGQKIDWENIGAIFNSGKERIKFYEDIWVLVDFVNFQYGNKIYTSNHPFHIKIQHTLDTLSHRVSDKVCHRSTVRRKSNSKIKDKGGVGGKETQDIPDTLKSISGFTDAWQKWEQHRSEIRHPLKPTTIKEQLKFLAKQSDPVSVIEQSIRQGWQGLFELGRGIKSSVNQAPSSPLGKYDGIGEEHNVD